MLDDTPPFKDTNNNGKLDSEEIKLQLSSEERAGGARSGLERGHGILEMLGLRIGHAEYGIFKALTVDPIFLEEEAKILGDAFKEQINIITTEYKDKDAWMENARKEALEKKYSGDRLQVFMEDKESLYDFAASFSKTFPNGIQIAAKDIAEIQGHMVGDLIPEVTRTNERPKVTSDKPDLRKI